MTTATTRQRYCEPANAGLQSEPRAVGRRLGRLLDALGREVNGYVASGQIDEDIRAFRLKLIDNLKADGWRLKMLESNRWSVLPPKEGRA